MLYICDMKSKIKNKKKAEKENFIKEYNEIVRISESSVIIESEWKKEGDYFQKFTLYDNNYTIVPTLGETTLINTI